MLTGISGFYQLRSAYPRGGGGGGGGSMIGQVYRLLFCLISSQNKQQQNKRSVHGVLCVFCILGLCFLKDCVLQFGEIAHTRVHY